MLSIIKLSIACITYRQMYYNNLKRNFFIDALKNMIDAYHCYLFEDSSIHANFYFYFWWKIYH